MNKLIAILAACVSVAVAQTLSNPKLVTATRIFAWDRNPEDPPTAIASYNVYAAVTGTTNPVRQTATTMNSIPLGTLFGTAPFGSYTLWVIAVDKDGVLGDPSTNFYSVYWRGKGKPPINLR